MTLRRLAKRIADAPTRTRALLGACACAAALLLATASSPPVAAAGRASLIALALAAVGWRLRRASEAPQAGSPIEITARRALSRDASVALVTVRGRALLVGWGPDGVRLLADVGPADGGGAR